MLRGSTRVFLQQTTRHVTSSSLSSVRFSSSLTTSTKSTRSLATTRRPLALTVHPAYFLQVWRNASSDSSQSDKEKGPKVARLATKTSGDPEASTTRSVFSEVPGRPEPDQQKAHPESKKAVKSGIAGDLQAIRETFALSSVPREAYVLGFAGLIPYVTTSLASVYCAWDVHYAHTHGNGILLSEESAAWLLQYLEPLQVGYGAVILSFLGAIHWGLEWAKYGGTFGYRRYAIGVIAPAIAWPTILLSYEYALITQFLGFTYLYYADAAATSRGWAPPWYSTYRFVLTFLAGTAIVISLVGKSEIHDVLERKALGSGAVTDPKDKITQGLSEGDKQLAAYETERSKVWDKKEEKRKEEEKKVEEEEEEKKKNKGKKKKDDSAKAGGKDDEEEEDDDSEDGDDAEESKDNNEDGEDDEEEDKKDDDKKDEDEDGDKDDQTSEGDDKKSKGDDKKSKGDDKNQKKK